MKSPFNMVQKRVQLSRLNGPRVKDFCYLRSLVADQLVERVLDITRSFNTITEIGCMNGEFFQAMHREDALSKVDSFHRLVWTEAQLNCDPSLPRIPALSETVISDWSKLPLKPASSDLIVSNLALHNVNDLPSTLLQISQGLKPDGAFLGAIFGGNTLQELNASFAIAEQEREGGVGMHVHPFLPVRDACGLLNTAGLQLITVDSLEFTVEFDNAFSLMRHLWWMGEGCSLNNRRAFVSKETLLSCAAIYQGLYGTREGTVPATFEVIFMIGWSPHALQPKPLKPSTPQVSFAKLGKGGDV